MSHLALVQIPMLKKNLKFSFITFFPTGGEKHTGGGRESGSDSWKLYMRRSTW